MQPRVLSLGALHETPVAVCGLESSCRIGSAVLSRDGQRVCLFVKRSGFAESR
jgi:hypothetical protein